MTQPVSIGIVRAVRCAVPLFAALVAFFWATLPARADETVSAHQMMYSGTTLCVHGYSELIRHDTAVATEWNIGLYPGVILSTFSSCPSNVSNYYYTSVPTGWAAIGRQLLMWNGSSWSLCKDWGWSYNTSPVASQYLTLGGGMAAHPCGVGYYGLYGGFYAWDGSAWQGGWLWSGYLYSQ
jgi:hypothetical protein